VIWKVVKGQSSLLFHGNDEGSSVCRKCGEARIREWAKQNMDMLIPSIEQRTVLNEHNTEPLQQPEELLQCNVSIQP